MTVAAAPLALQTAAELAELVEVYREVRPERVLEIGVAHGGTLYMWLTEGAPRLVVAVDTFTYADPRPLFPEWQNGSCEVVAIEGDSQDRDIADRVATHAPFDWVFIDGDHSYQAVKRDWDTYRTMVIPGGVVVFHDIRYALTGVPQLWAEIVASDYLTHEIVVEASPTLGIGLVWP